MSPLENPLHPSGTNDGHNPSGQPRTARQPHDRRRLHQRLRKEAEWNAGLCDSDHRALTGHERIWRASHFAGYRAVGDLLYEHRQCPRCDVTISRPIRFVDALSQALIELQSPQQPSEIVTASASLLLSWAGSNLPMYLGLARLPEQRERADQFVPGDEHEDWQQFGIDLRQRREAASLTREQLCTLAGVSHATVRNIETGRHRPTARILRRLVAVPALRLSEARDLVGQDSPP